MPLTYAFKRRLNTIAASGGKDDFGYAFKWTGEGRGTLRSGALESSNVNVVEELVDMIETQRAYEVNSKMIQAAAGPERCPRGGRPRKPRPTARRGASA